LSVDGALISANIILNEADRIVPPRERLIWDLPLIYVERAHPILVKTPDEILSLSTPERIPANILSEIGIPLFPQDQFLRNGQVINPNLPLEDLEDVLIQFQPATPIYLTLDGATHPIYTDQATLGQALEAAEVPLSPRDWVSEDLMAPVKEGMVVTIRRARPVTVNLGGKKVSGLTAATTVGEALQEIGLPLQGLDYSLPGEGESIPNNGEISMVSVDEEVVITTEETPYENEYVEDPETELDQVVVVQAGQMGIYATRERVQYADGVEVRRYLEGRWQASEPRDGILGYGTKAVIRTEVVDGVTIEYWRKKTVYATSYEPCDNQGVCHDGTAGGYPLQRGIVAVTPQWYSVPNGLAMADLPVYVPGYGRAIIGDVGGGIPGTPWIDVAYRPEDDFTWDAHWTTMYFLTPVPNWYPAMITP